MSETAPPGITLGPTRYGKAEVRLLHVVRGSAEHGIRDLNISVALSGDQADTHLTGDNAKVLTTDAQKNAVYALARKDGVGAPESFALRLARHFLSTCSYITRAGIRVDEYGWDRIPGTRSRHSFARSGRLTRTALVRCASDGAASVISGLKDLVLLNTTGSEFHGFFRDEYTTLPETTDRILATAVTARWQHSWTPDRSRTHSTAEPDWDKSHEQAVGSLTAAFADTYSYSLQQTLYAMGRRLLEKDPEVREVRLALPNKHHFAVDLAPFGVVENNEVFHPADRPYGLIEGTVLRGGAADPGDAWD
ncbi:MAG TPA: urate oxidase [Actinocrinis sp.]